MRVLIALTILILSVSAIRVSIDHYGAVRNKDYLGAHLINQKALYAAIADVNASTDTIREVVIPKGNYYMLPVQTTYVDNFRVN